MLGKGCSDSYPPIEITEGNRILTGNREKANSFNEFFLSHSNVDSTNAVLPDLGDDLLNVIEDITATEEEISVILMNLDVNKASGPDGISARLMKEAGHAIVPSFTRLINLSFEMCKMPSLWKKAFVIPIHKKGSKSSLNNYRPISLLPVPSKIIEKIVFKNVYHFFDTNDLLSQHQSGFRPNDSTVNQLAFLYNEFCKALDMKKDVRIVFCDISKAFDKVWFDGLLFKLEKNGIKGNLLSWFQNYLMDRYQQVVIRGEQSEWGLVNAGVPQGSVLGPLLFIVYINDLAEAVNCKIKMFADDTSLYIDGDNPEASADVLDSNLENVKKWAEKWLVDFNPGKTKSMTISNKTTVHPPLTFNGNVLDEVKSNKHLGVTFSSNLSWSQHINDIVNSVSKPTSVLQGLKHRLDRKTLENVYTTFIRPKLEYASPIWADCTKSDVNKIETCQITAAKIVTGAKKGTSHIKLLKEVGWTKLEERRRVNQLCVMHKMVHKHEPEYLHELLPDIINDDIHYDLRNKNNLREFLCRTEKYKNSFIPKTIKEWNNLPEDFKNQPNYDIFKRQLTDKDLCNSLYHYGNRNVNIIHAQLRMNCSNLKNDLFKLHVADSPSCSCTNPIEDATHYFLECPLYTDQRVNLIADLSQITEVDVDVILHGKEELPFENNIKIFQAVHEFIITSERFSI